MSAKRVRFGQVFLAALVVAALAAPSSGAAAADEAKKFHFKLEPFDFEALFTDVDTNSSKFEEYRDMDSGAVVRVVRLLGESGDRNREFEFHLLNAGRDDGRYTMRYRNSGRFAVVLDYNIIPHRFGNDGTQLHSNASGRDIFTISDTTQQTLQDEVAMNGTGFDVLRAALQPFIDTANIVDPMLERRRFRATVDIDKMHRLGWKVDLKQETRDGSRPYGATFGFSGAIELPEPVRYDTKTAEISGEWRAERGGMRFGLNVSDFSNTYNTMTYDNPFRVSDSIGSGANGPAAGRNVLAPDNRASQLFLSGHARLGAKGWLNGNVSLGRMEQDDPLRAHTINTAINPTVDPTIPFDASDPANLPATHADMQVDVLHFTANAGTKLTDWASVKVRARYYDYDNKSAVLRFPGYVRMDYDWEDVPRTTVPYAYTTQKYGVEFGFDPVRKTHVAVGYDLLSWDRDYREVSSSDEDILHVTVDTRTLDNVMLTFGWEYGDRSVDDYDVAAQLFSFTDPDERVGNQFGLRKYDEAARTYNEGRILATIAASDAISVTLGASVRNEDYDDTVLVPDPTDPDPTYPTLPLVTGDAMGLLSEDLQNYNAEVSYTPGETLSFFVFGSRTDRETFQRARQSGGTLSTNPLDTWELTLDEVTDTWGLGLNANVGGRWTVNVTGSWSNSDGNSDFFTPPGGSPNMAESFPEYDDNEWIVYSAGFVFHVNENMETGVTLVHDEFTTNRFSRNGLEPYLPGALILDLNDGDYDADLLMAGLRVRF